MFVSFSFSVSEAVENDIGLRGPTESGNRQKMKKGTGRISHKTLFCDVPMQNGGGWGGGGGHVFLVLNKNIH